MVADADDAPLDRPGCRQRPPVERKHAVEQRRERTNVRLRLARLGRLEPVRLSRELVDEQALHDAGQRRDVIRQPSTSGRWRPSDVMPADSR